MEITAATYTGSYVTGTSCPKEWLPEFAFIGRSNVGKSSLINMLCQSKNLVHVSQSPGKTRTINFFRINQSFHFVDLPGYGFAKASRQQRKQLSEMISNYLDQRMQLQCLLVLIDIRLKPQKIDLGFIDELGAKQIPFVLVFTKADKVSLQIITQHTGLFKSEMEKNWAAIPPEFITSSETKRGRTELLAFFEKVVAEFRQLQPPER